MESATLRFNHEPAININSKRYELNVPRISLTDKRICAEHWVVGERKRMTVTHTLLGRHKHHELVQES
jgi:hypothetical protein